MEEGGLKQIDLIDCFGSQSVVSAVLAGPRQINTARARRLARRFGLPLAMFCALTLDKLSFAKLVIH